MRLSTWSISGTDLKRHGIQSVEEAIRSLGHLSDNIGLHIAVLIDGNQAGGSAKTARGTQQDMFPIELVDPIEVVLGPGSVVNGNRAGCSAAGTEAGVGPTWRPKARGEDGADRAICVTIDG